MTEKTPQIRVDRTTAVEPVLRGVIFGVTVMLLLSYVPMIVWLVGGALGLPDFGEPPVTLLLVGIGLLVWLVALAGAVLMLLGTSWSGWLILIPAVVLTVIELIRAAAGGFLGLVTNAVPFGGSLSLIVLVLVYSNLRRRGAAVPPVPVVPEVRSTSPAGE